MMRRKKLPSDVQTEEKVLRKIVKNLSKNWNAEERETSILFDHSEKVVFLETTYPATARRWLDNLHGDPDVLFDKNADSLKLRVPWEYCRRPDLIIKAKHRSYDQ
jgi:hypothetical protein